MKSSQLPRSIVSVLLGHFVVKRGHWGGKTWTVSIMDVWVALLYVVQYITIVGNPNSLCYKSSVIMVNGK